MTTAVGLNTELYLQISQFLYREVRLFDNYQFEEWLELFTEDINCSLWTRRDEEGMRVEEGLPLVDADRRGLELRVQRLRGKYAYSDIPMSRVRHIITNIEVEEISAVELKVFSNFIFYRSRLEKEEEFTVGHREDILRRVGDSWKIAKRTVIFDHNLFPARNVSLFFGG